MADEFERLERHVPIHPLPEEIQTMTKDDTVCQFCGVSYLIHREIKKLEDRIKVSAFNILYRCDDYLKMLEIYFKGT